MGFVLFILFVGGVIIFVRSQLRKQLNDSWSLAARTLGLRVQPSGSVSGYPALYGLIDGRRVDVAPFVLREMGTTPSRMTGYRFRCDRPVDLPASATTSLSNRFSRFEIDDRSVFCATQGVESSSSDLIAAVRSISEALRQADAEADRKLRAYALEAEPPAPKPEPEPEPLGVIDEAKPEPPPLPDAGSDPDPEAKLELDPVAFAALAGPADAEVGLPGEPEIASNDAGTSSVIEDESKDDPPPSSREPASLTEVAGALFESGLGRFAIGQHFDETFAGREFSGTGHLRRIESFANDRHFGRGPGVIAEVEILEMEDSAIAGVNRVHARLALPAREDITPLAQAREWRRRIGEPVELCGTLEHCDVFQATLLLSDGVVA